MDNTAQGCMQVEARLVIRLEEMAGVSQDFPLLLSGLAGDFLLRSNGLQVKAESLKEKKIWLYFSASWSRPCRRFTPKLAKVSEEFSSKANFEIIFVSLDKDHDMFDEYFSKMPWLAIPFAESDMRDGLKELFKVKRIPSLVMLDESGKVLSTDGIEIIKEFEEEGYPFTSEKIKELKAMRETAKKEQSLKSLLVTQYRDYVISNDGRKVPVSELEGKTVGLYFSMPSFKPCGQFTRTLVDVYEKVRAKGESFEIVLIWLDDEEESFKQEFASMPWFGLPCGDKSCEKLASYFKLTALPTLVAIGQDGRTLHFNVADAIERHGIKAYPFTPEKFVELEELEKAKQEEQTLESLLVSEDADFVIGKDGVKIPVSDLAGKNILLYFSAHWCPPCRAFSPKLIETYHKIKAKDETLEVIFISSDRDQTSFDLYFSAMPWLAVPFGDQRQASLSSKFKIKGIPSLIAIGPTGRTVTTEARSLVMVHGADAYPFTEEHMKEMEAQMAKEWPEKVKYAGHEEHELVLAKRSIYICNGCKKEGYLWSFHCAECDHVDLHPKCALEDELEKANPGEGWKCDGEVCYGA